MKIRNSVYFLDLQNLWSLCYKKLMVSSTRFLDFYIFYLMKEKYQLSSCNLRYAKGNSFFFFKHWASFSFLSSRQRIDNRCTESRSKITLIFQISFKYEVNFEVYGIKFTKKKIQLQPNVLYEIN